MPAATAAAEPPEDPPGDSRGSHGFRVVPKTESVAPNVLSTYVIRDYDSLPLPSMPVTVIDNDQAGVLLTQTDESTDVTEGSGSDTDREDHHPRQRRRFHDQPGGGPRPLRAQ